MPVSLFICGITLAFKINLFHILAPKRFFQTLKNAVNGNGISPIKAMCTALAGTLGVGNIAGVATAITAGGAGAVMWMWIGSLVSMSIKYCEVALAVKYRFKKDASYVGGTMYTIRDGLRPIIGKRRSYPLGAIFAFLCIMNALVMGNVIQTNAACSVFSAPKWIISVIFAAILILVSVGGAKTISNITYAIIPILSAVYMICSVSVICRNLTLVPKVFSTIVGEAFNIRSAVSGGAGYGITKAIRYGVTRGIFSNEAGCGTSPTAHASADTKSPHHQGCFGIFEVIADTPILCTMTALVILIAKIKYPYTLEGLDGIPLSLVSFEILLGECAYYIIGAAVVLFALATVIAQLYYGNIAMGYFTDSKESKLFPVIFSIFTLISNRFPSDPTWFTADIIIAVMTCLNVWVLLVMRNEAVEISRRESPGKE